MTAFALLPGALAAPFSPLGVDTNKGLPQHCVQLASDGSWSWFSDPRALFHKGDLYFGYVKTVSGSPTVSVFNPVTRKATELFGFSIRKSDDHNNPAIAALADGKLFAAATGHHAGSTFFYRGSSSETPRTKADWSPERASSASPDNLTYVNPLSLSEEPHRLYLFARGINYNPTLFISENCGKTFGAPKHFIARRKGNIRPYAKYATNRRDRFDVVYTDGHPRNVTNSIYHLFYQSSASGKPGSGYLCRSDGTHLKQLSSLPLEHDDNERGSPIYKYSAEPSGDPHAWLQNGRAWMWDLSYDESGSPVCAFQVSRPVAVSKDQEKDVLSSLWPGMTKSGRRNSIYYYYARWTGKVWQKRLIASGGSALYDAEEDYGAGMSIDPQNANVVYISSNARSPFALQNVSDDGAAKNRRYEIYRGVTNDGGLTFKWQAITSDSSEDNLRPYVPRGHSPQAAVLWMRGTYLSYRNSLTRIVGLFEKQR